MSHFRILTHSFVQLQHGGDCVVMCSIHRSGITARLKRGPSWCEAIPAA